MPRFPCYIHFGLPSFDKKKKKTYLADPHAFRIARLCSPPSNPDQALLHSTLPAPCPLLLQREVPTQISSKAGTMPCSP